VKTTRRSTGQGSSRPEFRFNNNPYVVQELRWKDSPRTDYDGVIADSPLPFLATYAYRIVRDLGNGAFQQLFDPAIFDQPRDTRTVLCTSARIGAPAV